MPFEDSSTRGSAMVSGSVGAEILSFGCWSCGLASLVLRLQGLAVFLFFRPSSGVWGGWLY